MSEKKENQVDKVNSTDSTQKKAKAPKAEPVAKSADSKPAKTSAAKAEPAAKRVVRLKDKYKNEVIAALREKFSYKNINEVPKLEKIVLNMGLGADKDNAKGMQNALEEMKQISGQKAVATTAKVSVANFKVRTGQNIGAKVTLRGNRMYDFLDKLIAIALPRVRDFRGLSSKSFDGRGNYAMGVKEQLIFPEITYEQVDRTRGMDICIVTTAKSDEEALELLRALGMPFRN